MESIDNHIKHLNQFKLKNEIVQSIEIKSIEI